MIAVSATSAGGLLELLGARRRGRHRRVVHPRRGRPPERARRSWTQLRADIARILGDVRAAVDDWQAMRERGRCDRWPSSTRAPPPARRGELPRPRDFLRVAAPTTTSPSSATATTTLVRRRRRGHAAARPGPGPGHPARHGPGQAVSGSFAELPPELRALAREPRLARSSPRPTPAPPCTGPAYLDYIGVKRFDAAGRGRRRAPLPRPLHLGRLQRSPRDIPLLRRKVARCSSAPAFPAAATTARRCSTSWRPTRATSCSRSPTTSCSRSPSASCACRSASGCACSCAATPSGASSPASSTCRATATTRPCARAHRRTILHEAVHGGQRRVHGAGCRNRCSPGSTSSSARRRATCPTLDAERDRGRAGRGHPLLGRRPPRRAGRGARRGARAPRCATATAEAFPAAYRDDCPGPRRRRRHRSASTTCAGRRRGSR